MNEQQTVQELKSERVQEPALEKRRLPRPDDTGGPAVFQSPGQARTRLKSERVQLRLKQLPGWRMQSGGRAIDRMRQFPDPMAAASYLAFAAMLARSTGQVLQAYVNGSTIIVALPGRSTRPGAGLTEEVLDLAEQLG
jgi:pterin-4a-carbinolamine dehydratase